MSIKIVLATAGLAIVGLTSSAASFAATETQIDTRVSETLLYFNSINPENRVLGDKAAGVLVFPRVTKGGIGLAGESPVAPAVLMTRRLSRSLFSGLCSPRRA